MMLNRKIKRHLFTRRAFTLGLIKTGLLSGLVARLYYLQIVKQKEYRTFSDSNRIRLSLIPPLRGRILDRDGRDLAINENYYRIVLDPEVTSDRDAIIERLIERLELGEEEKQVVWKKVQAHRSRRPLMLYERLTWRQLARVEVFSPELPGISIDVGQMRYFPMQALSPHIIGYLGPVSDAEIKRNPLLNHPDFKIGINGIEQSFDSVLRGKIGVKRTEVNAFGAPVSELSRDESAPGTDLYLTLDKRLQTFVSQRLQGNSASAIVMNAVTGDILAIASTPGFDPNHFTYGISRKEWNALIHHTEHPLVNKALSNQYPPGSTFKMIVALAALKEKVDPNSTVFCPGYVMLGRRRFHCWKKEGHGHMSMVDALKNSCNAYFFTVAKRIGIDPIEAMAKLFGLGDVHDIGVAEQKAGRVPSKSWKQERFKESWQLGDTLNTGIGQGMVLTTPLQLAIMVSRIATGRKIIPILTRTPQPMKDLPPTEFDILNIPVEHLTLVREGMRRVVNVPGGTAYGSRITAWEHQMAGKTGTSQVVSRRFTPQELAMMTPDQQKKLANHALFVGFAPVHDPRYAVSVVVEHGGGGSKAAAPIARDILQYVQKL